MPAKAHTPNRFLVALSGWVLVAIVSSVSAEVLPIRAYRQRDGLAHQNVRSILQDTRGFLWMGTANGLSRFDGSGFVTYGRDHGLPGAAIKALLELESGVLLVGTDLGLFRFDGRAAVPAASPSPLGFEMTGPIYQLLRDGAGRIWIGAGRGLFSLESGSGEEFSGPIPFDTPVREVRALTVGRDGGLWVGSASGLLRRAPDGEVEDLGLGRAARAVAEDRSGRIWIGLEPGLAVLLPPWAETLEPSPVGLPSRPGELRAFGREQGFAEATVRALYLDAGGSLWIGAVGGLYKADDLGLERYGLDHGLSDLTVNVILEDRSGRLWLGSDLGGAMRWSREGLVSYTLADGLGHDTVDSVIEADEGIFLYNGERAILSRPAGPGWVATALGLPDAIVDRVPRRTERAMRDSHGEWWITTGRGLLRYASLDDLVAGRTRAHYTVDNGLASNATYKVQEDSRGDLWVLALESAPGALTRWRRSDETFERFSIADGLPEEGHPTSFAEVSGQPLFGWNTGSVVRLDASSFEVFPVADGMAIEDLLVDRAGTLWVATAGEGLFRMLEPAAGQPSAKRVAGGLPRNCRALAEDEWRRIYVGTVAGVFRFDPETDRVEALAAGDTSTAREITTAHIDAKGSMWFGSFGGLLRLDPYPIAPASSATAYLSGVTIDGRPQPVSGMGQSEVGPLVLSGRGSTLQFDYFGIDLDPGREPRFQFRLEGADAEWSAGTKQQSVIYANLAPGTYRFVVRSMPAQGSRLASVRFRIPPPVWQRAWFVSIVALALAALLALAHRIRLRRLIAVERVRTRIAADLHDDVGASLSRISLLSEVAKGRRREDADEALGRIGEIARDLSSRTREIVWSMNPRFDDFDSFVVRLRETAGELFDDRGVEWDLEAPTTGGRVHLRPELRRHLLMVFKEALVNIARHAAAGRVSISLSLTAGKLRGAIRDDGAGFEAAELPTHSGSGLENIRSRIAALGGRLDLRSHPGEGTILQFELEA